ncbi:hypothetical protein J4234_01725 [Candidatus Woesearchaeota archaeon]|nr:hypothetical protein [Candidatus Woesearchaeota archaeon]
MTGNVNVTNVRKYLATFELEPSSPHPHPSGKDVKVAVEESGILEKLIQRRV